MSDITIKQVQNITKLSRIEVAEDQQERVASSLNKVIDWVDSLNEVNVDNIEPFTNPHNLAMPLSSDEIKVENDIDQVLENAPNVKYNYFTVPKVIE